MQSQINKFRKEGFNSSDSQGYQYPWNLNEKFVFEVKGDDVNLAVDLISGAYENLYDTAIIVSGDEDFVPAIKKVQKLGKKVINAYFKSSSSAALKKTCDDFIYMNKILKDIKN